jgi:hypothetical protein
MASSEAALRVDDHSAVADASFKDGHYSLFVEATGGRRSVRLQPDRKKPRR